MSSGAIGLGALGLAYFMSQFYRAFLAVLYAPLNAELGLSEAAASTAQSAWWAVFALAQFPVGWALDKIGPRRTASVLLALAGGGGCMLFSLAQEPADLTVAMGLIGLGCSPVLMASYFIYARQFDPARFATYAALLIAFGTLGNVAASEPLSLLASEIGWRSTAVVLAGVAVAIGAATLIFVQDPPRIEGAQSGGFLDILKISALWLVLPMVLVNYAAAANLRSPWAGTFFPDVFAPGADDAAGLVGAATFWMALAMAAGTLIYGPLDRLFGSRKAVVIGGNLVVVALLITLAMTVGDGLTAATAMILFAAIGAFGHSYPIVVAHGQSFLPPHLVGRGVTFINFFSIGGVALLQFSSAQVFTATREASLFDGGFSAVPSAHAVGRLAEAAFNQPDPSVGYAAVFSFYAVVLTIGLTFYVFSVEKHAPQSYWARRRASAARQAR